MFNRAMLNTIILALLATCLTLNGCRLKPREPGPAAEPEAPPLPEAIRQEGGGEPIIKVYMHEAGTVEEMGIEEYISGVVAAEMDPQWPEEALAAQAIIARSFTLQKIGEEGGVPEHGAHASTDIEEFQAYSAERINERVRKAVNKTKGQVAVYRNEFIRGWFHAFAGPRTALADEGLDFEEGNPPYIQIVESPGKEIVPEEEGYWSASFSSEEVRAAVKEVTGSDPGPIVEFEISKKGPSGRATRFKINGVELSAPSLRLALGSTEMRSTYIEELEVLGDQVNLSGVGYGHGVGMCQWGARALAEDNWSARDIVKYFYRDIEIVQAWS